MSPLAETLLTALCVSSLAACCLFLLPRTPPRVRFAIAVAGLAAWAVPWGAIRIALPSSNAAAAPILEWFYAAASLAPPSAAPPSAAVRALAGFPGPTFEIGAVLACTVAAAFLVGIAFFVGDCIVLQRCARAWYARSRPGDGLRALLPPELAGVAARIRIVERSGIAAVTGALRPTIWLGDRHMEAHVALVLTHEIWHVRARDPWWLFAIMAIRRAYWWNPLVAHLARQAVLMIESTCDHRCAAHFGKANYTGQLASILLAARAPAPRLAATAGTGSFDVQRLRLLGEPLRLRARDLVLIAALCTAGAATAAAALVERLPLLPEHDGPQPELPATPAGNALAALIRAANDGNAEHVVELLGAYTPQEVPLPMPAGGGVRVVELLHSEPLRVEYVVESASGARYAAEIVVSPSAPSVITATRLRPLP